MTPRSYATPEAFKEALDQRLRSSASSSPEFVRKRQHLVFDRFLARIVAAFGNTAMLKGGLVLELRLERARTTKDVDLTITGTPHDLLARLQEACGKNLGDFMIFEIAADADHPEIRSEGMIDGGLRFRAKCMLAERLYGQAFGVDVVLGDPMCGEPEMVAAKDVLAFAGIAPPVLRIYALESHIAEKLHAYTLPRMRPNSRVKDLPDLALLATARAIDSRRLGLALEMTFASRNTHSLPGSVPLPAEEWRSTYEAMALEDQLPWPTLEEVTAAASAFLDPLLAGGFVGTWQPADWRWR